MPADPRLSFLTSLSEAESSDLLSRLTRTRIRILAAPDAVASLGGQVLLYQLTTLLARLFDDVQIDGDAAVQAHPDFALLEGPVIQAVRDASAAARVRLAPTAPPTSQLRIGVGSEQPGAECDLYVGSSGWSAVISRTAPQPVSTSRVVVGPLAAGALAAAEVFKHVFGDVVPGTFGVAPGGPDGFSLSLLDYGPADAGPAPEPEVPDRIVLDAVLFGVGSLGCALLLGIAATPQLQGSLVVVDNGTFDEGNPFKYTLLDAASARTKCPKAPWAEAKLAGLARRGLVVSSFEGTAYQYVASLPPDYRLPLVVSAVDTVEARLEVQDTIPQRIVNAGVSGTEAEVSVHGFGEGPCLACLGIESGRESSHAHRIAEDTGLDVSRVLELLMGNVAMVAADIEQLRRAARLPLQLQHDLDRWAGQPLMSLYNRLPYSEASAVTASGAQVRVTTAFVSAFAGVLLLAELLKKSCPSLEKYNVSNSYRQEMLGIPAGGVMQYERNKSGNCLCHSSFRQMIFREKYGSHAGTAG